MDTALIFQNLVHNRDYIGKVLPYLKEDFFQTEIDKKLFEIYKNHVTVYREIPTPEVLEFELKRVRGLHQTDFETAIAFVQTLKTPVQRPDLQYLVDMTEEWCLHQSVYNAITKSIHILDDDSGIPKTAIPDILKDALSVSFNNEIGHDYSENVETRYNKLHEQTARLLTGISWIDNVYGGGIPRKTLSILMAQSGGGKSLFKSHLAAHFYHMGYNTLYVTLELSEERIGERVDANLMDIDVADIPALDFDTYSNKVAKIAEKTKARLFIKEYPPATITAAHIRALIDELKLKKGFVPDVLVVDYLNLMNSSRFKAASGANSYTIIKAVAEELRALGTELNMAVLTSTQMNRGGIQGSDPDMTAVSESLGIVMTADVMIAIIRSDELDQMGNVLLKCLKTRFSSLTNHKSLVGVNWNRMKVIDRGENATVGVAQDPAFLLKQIEEEKPKQPAFVRENKHNRNLSNIKV